MRRLGGIWPQVAGFENLLLAYRQARRGKGRRPDVLRFALNLETELLGLQRELWDDSYRPGAYRLFRIYERKPRTIAAAPFRDRVVHHAVMNLIEPPLDRTFIHDSYACRQGKGVHAAVDRYQGWARRHAYALKMDVAQYFPSIDHRILNHRRLRNDNGHRFARRMRAFARAYAAGLIELDDIEPSLQSWIGHARHADTLGLRARILCPIVFRRGRGREAAGGLCAAAPGTTTRRTSARPTATGTTPTTGTTTSACVSPSPPARP